MKTIQENSTPTLSSTDNLDAKAVNASANFSSAQGLNHIYGTAGNDTIIGTAGNDHMHGQGGNDSFFGGLGNDYYLASAGGFSEVEFAGKSSEYTFKLNSDGSVTTKHAVYGTDYLQNIYSAWFRGDQKWSTIEDLLKGDDTIYGTNGNDTIIGTNGDDVIKAGDGNDLISVGSGNDIVDGEGGYDGVDLFGNSADYTFTQLDNGSVKAVHADYGTKTLSNVETAWFRGDNAWKTIEELLNGSSTNTINGTNGDDYIVGTDGDDVINAGAGDDYIEAGDGDDVINGGDGVDVMVGGKGDDFFDGGGGDYNQVNLEGKYAEYTFVEISDGSISAEHAVYGTDILKNIDGVYFAGDNAWKAIDDLVDRGDATNIINGTSGDDYIVGTNGDDTINAGEGNDYIVAGDGDDIIYGGDGVDVMVGGKGDDIFYGGGGEYNQVNLEGKYSDYTFVEISDGSLSAEHAEYGTDILKDIDGVFFEGDNVWHSPDELVA